jgi:hypothetical protein
MTDIDQKTQNGLDEGHTLILGAQILLGALYRTVFEPGYQQFSRSSKYLVLSALVLNILSVVLLIAPAPYHQIVEHGKDDARFNAFVMRAMAGAMIPFAGSLGLSLYVFFGPVIGPAAAALLGAGAASLSGFLWYGARLIPHPCRGQRLLARGRAK